MTSPRDQLYVLISTFRTDNTLAIEYGMQNLSLEIDETRNQLAEILLDCIDHFEAHDLEQGIIIKLEYIRQSLPKSYKLKCQYDSRDASWKAPFDKIKNIMLMAAKAECETELLEPSSPQTMTFHLKRGK